MTFWVAGAIAVAGIAGAVSSGISSSNAAHTQAQAAQNSLQLQQAMYNQTVGNEAPFLNAGEGALSSLNYGLGIGKPGEGGTGTTLGNGGAFGSLNAPFTASMMKQYSPAYQFQLQQGQQGVLNQTAGASGALSGAALKDLTSFNQGYANTAFGSAFSQYQAQQSNTFNRLAGIAQLGQGAASNQATGGSNFASGIGQSAQNVGTALGAGQIGVGNAISGGLGSLGALPWLSSVAGGGNTYSPGYATNGGYVYNGVTQNGGMGGGIGNIVGNVEGP